MKRRMLSTLLPGMLAVFLMSGCGGILQPFESSSNAERVDGIIEKTIREIS